MHVQPEALQSITGCERRVRVKAFGQDFLGEGSAVGNGVASSGTVVAAKVLASTPISIE
jgi:hypothetical protein